MHFAFAFLTLYVLFRIQFWVGVTIILYFAALLTFTYFVLFLIKNKPFKLPQILLLAYFAVSVFLWIVPTHKIYYCKQMSTLKENSSWDFEKWNDYSWYLYQDGKYNDALKANKKAQDALVANTVNSRLDEKYTPLFQKDIQEILWREVYMYFLLFFEQSILDKNWTDPYIVGADLSLIKKMENENQILN